MPRLTHDRPGYCYACPACDTSGNLYERTGTGNAKDDRPYRCNAVGCGVSLTYVIERPKKHPGVDQTTITDHTPRRPQVARELAAMSPEDVGLPPLGVRGGAD